MTGQEFVIEIVQTVAWPLSIALSIFFLTRAGKRRSDRE